MTSRGIFKCSQASNLYVTRVLQDLLEAWSTPLQMMTGEMMKLRVMVPNLVGKEAVLSYFLL